MADPTYYRVTVNRPFKVGDVIFMPAAKQGPQQGYPCYRVPPDLYNGQLDDGTAFKDVCDTAEPGFPIET